MSIPWLTIILALLSFFASKRSGASNTKAALTAGLVGASSYYVTHETDWGKANLGALDGVVPSGAKPLLDGAGQPVTAPDGKPIMVDGNSSQTTIADILKSWGATGTATVIGTTAAAGGGVFSSKNLPWLIAGVGLLIILKD